MVLGKGMWLSIMYSKHPSRCGGCIIIGRLQDLEKKRPVWPSVFLALTNSTIRDQIKRSTFSSSMFAINLRGMELGNLINDVQNIYIT